MQRQLVYRVVMRVDGREVQFLLALIEAADDPVVFSPVGEQ